MRLDACWCTAVLHETLEDLVDGTRVTKPCVHQTVKSFDAAHLAGRHACGMDHASLLLLSGAPGEAAEATMCLQHLCSADRGELLEDPDRSTSELTVCDWVLGLTSEFRSRVRHDVVVHGQWTGTAIHA